jgi:transcription elongation factor GreA
MARPAASDLIRAVGLLPDGPVLWGRPVRSGRPGVYLVELPAPLTSAPLDLARVGKWLERATDLLLDGTRPTSKALQARLARDWLADDTVLFLGSATGSLAARVADLQRTPAGDERPCGDGLRLQLLRVVDTCRVWWAETDAPEEYEDALLDAFAADVGPRTADALGGFVAPFGVIRRPTGETRPDGITGAWIAGPAEPAAPPTRVVEVPMARAARQLGAPAPRAVAKAGPGAGSGANAGSAGSASPTRPGGTRAKGRATAASASRGAPGPGRPAGEGPDRGQGEGPGGTEAGTAPAAATRPAAEVVHLSAEGVTRLEAELRELKTVRRPEVVRRVAAARELGDLSENAEYHSSREELGFIDGRIQAIEGRLRAAVLFTGEDSSGRAVLGSTVVVETDGGERTLRLVGSAEADLAAGRISIASPVGKALVGRVAGDEVSVVTPAGPVVYRLLHVE